MSLFPRDPEVYRNPSVRALIAVNAIPLLGVLFFGWDMFTLISIYWLETAVIGFYTLVRIALLSGPAALFLIPFFTVHMGGFMAAHWVFLSAFFGPKDLGNHPLRCLGAALSSPEVLFMFALLLVSHGISFHQNHWVKHLQPYGAMKDDEKRESAKQFTGMLSEPYRRIVVMHVTIIFGAMLTMAFGTNRWMFALLVVLKTGADLKGHLGLHAAKEKNALPPQIENGK